tara:strand:- start:1891 stop:2208 length:318 start_codon:yes stop_codon:yes gene_type:complete
MNTVISDWWIVSIIDNNMLVGKILWGTVIDDMSCRFIKGDYVSSSTIIDINIDSQLIKTESGSLYQILGKGKRAKIKMEEHELLRQGFNPEQIISIRQSSRLIIH